MLRSVRRYAIAMTAAIAALSLASAARAQTARQTITFEVRPINVLAVTGTPALIINAAAPGSTPIVATSVAHYSVTTVDDNRKITVELDANMPAGLTLSATLTAPSGAVSTGRQILSATPTEMVRGMSRTVGNGLNISYELRAETTAPITGTRDVRFTILAGP